MSIILFDVDGTLIDSYPGIRAGYFHAIDQLGIPRPDEEFIRRIPGPPMEITMATTLKNAGLDTSRAREGFDYYMDYTRSGGWSEASAFPGMVELVAATHAAGHTVATATSKGEGFARKILEREGFLAHIDFLGAAQEDGPRRSKAAVIEYVLASNGWQDRTEEMLLIGDRAHDVEGAHAFGISTALVTWGYGAPEEHAMADYIAHTPAELEGIINDYA